MMPVLVAFASLILANAQPYPVEVSGYRHVLIRLSNGDVVGFGRPDSGQLGPIAAIPINNYGTKGLVHVKLPGKAKDIATGYETSVVVLEDGTVVCLGVDTCGFMGGLKLPDGRYGSENPVPLPGLNHVVKVEAYNKTFLALKDNGDVYGWGDKSFYGDGKAPTKIPGLANIVDLSVRSGCMALDKTGHVYTWDGIPWSGMLGRLDNLEGVGIVKGLDNVASIACGNSVCWAAKKDGTVWAWGSNYQGQLGNGKRADAPVRGSNQNDIQVQPKQVQGVSNVALVTNSNGGFGYAVLRDGTVKGWGNTQLSQMTHGTNDGYQKTPGTVTGIGNVKVVWAVSMNGFALKSDGSLWVWGNNFQSGYPLSKVTGTPTRIKIE